MGRVLTVILTAMSLASIANAQSYTDDELLGLFLKQQESMKGAATGATRGLKIVTRPQSNETASKAGATATVSEDGLTSLADLQKETVVRFDQEIGIRIKFEFDSSALSESEKPALDQMCRVMKKASDIQLFRIIGHTDSAGSAEYNKRLSELRAEEVGRHLVDNCGISRDRLEMIGYGEEFPKNPGDTRGPENRRVEFQALS